MKPQIRYRIMLLEDRHLQFWDASMKKFNRRPCRFTAYNDMETAREATESLRKEYPESAKEIYIDSFQVIHLPGINVEVECI